MDRKSTGLIATIVTALLCGCPGLFGLCLGATSVLASLMPGADIDVFGSSDPGVAASMGFVFLCLSVIFIAIPIVVGVVTLRKPKEGSPAVVDAKATDPSTGEPKEGTKPPAPPVNDEPLPPAS